MKYLLACLLLASSVQASDRLHWNSHFQNLQSQQAQHDYNFWNRANIIDQNNRWGTPPAFVPMPYPTWSWYGPYYPQQNFQPHWFLQNQLGR